MRVVRCKNAEFPANDEIAIWYFPSQKAPARSELSPELCAFKQQLAKAH